MHDPNPLMLAYISSLAELAIYHCPFETVAWARWFGIT